MRSPASAFDLRAALTTEVRAALAALDQGVAKPKAVHRCRVHIKRARALARIGRACAPGLSAVFNESARAAMRVLAQARDLTVLADTARALADGAGKKRARALKTVAAALDAERARAPTFNIDIVRAGLKDLLALAQVWPEASRRQIHQGAERVARRARRARVLGQGAEEAALRHEWRKREKDRLYAVLLLEGAWPEERARRRRLGEKLGEALGRERDALLLQDRIAANPLLAGGEVPARRAQRALARRCERLGRRADAIGAKLHSGGA